MSSPQIPPIIDDYELIEKVGQGGMGFVFKARQRSMDRIVAIKILPPEMSKDADFVSRFVREARLAGRLNHPNIVNAIGTGCDRGFHYISMEFVDGTNVRKLIEARGTIPEWDALTIIRQVALALESAHAHDLIHRDVKPDNIMFDSQGVAKLADLGLAKMQREDSSLTQTGMAVGTPHYVSPEQARGEKDVDRRADFYSLGATLYHMLTGKVPFEGPTGAVIMAKHLTEELVSPRVRRPDLGLSEGVCNLVAWLMKKERKQRPANARAIVDKINALLAERASGSTSKINVRNLRRTGPIPLDFPGSGRQDRRRTTGVHLPAVGGSAGAPGGAVANERRRGGTRTLEPANTFPAMAAGGAFLLLLVLGLALSGGDRPPVPSSTLSRPREAPATPLEKPASQPIRGKPDESAAAKAETAPAGIRPSNPVSASLVDPSVKPVEVIPDSSTRSPLISFENNGGSPEVPVRPERVAMTAVEAPAISKPALAQNAGAGAAAYEKVGVNLQKLGLKRDVSGAQKMLEEALRAAGQDAIALQLKEDLADMNRIQTLLNQAEKNVPACIGNLVTLPAKYCTEKEFKARVLEFQDGKVQVRTQQGAQFGFSMREEIAPTDVVTFFDKQIGMSEEDSLRTRVAFLLWVGEIESAEPLIRRLPSGTQPRYAGILETILKQRTQRAKEEEQKRLDAEADNTRKEIQRISDAGEHRRALEKLNEAEKKFAGREIFNATADWIERVRDKAALVAGRPKEDMLLVPAGPFISSSSDKEKKVLPAFKIDRCEVCNRDYRMFVTFLLAQGNLKQAAENLKTFRHEEGPKRFVDYVPRYFTEFDVAAKLTQELGKGEGEHSLRKEFSLENCRAWSKECIADDYPVTDVSWYAAWSFARWRGARLATADEWEKAARGTEGNLWPGGDTQEAKAATRYNAKDKLDHFEKLAPVTSGEDAKSPFGCLNMSGNVWEWIADPLQCRGGGHDTQLNILRLDYRGDENRQVRNWRSCQHGIRCAKDK